MRKQGEKFKYSIFCEYFGDVYKSNFIPENSGNSNYGKLNYVNTCDEVRLEEISESIDKMNTNDCMGPDVIPGLFIKNYKTTIILLLYRLLNKSVMSAITPDR